MIHVLAIVTAKPGYRHRLLALFRSVVPAVLAEPGCLEYGAAVEQPDEGAPFGPDTFVVFEKWEDRAALQRHAASPHMTAYREKAEEMLGSVRLHVLDPT